MDPIAPITNQPKSNDQPQSQSVPRPKPHHHPKWDFVNNKHNTGKNWCDNFWWLVISVIIFGMGAYVRYDLIKDMIVMMFLIL